MDQLNKTYEMLYFLPITLSDEEIKSIKNKIHEIFEKYHVTIIKEEDLGKRKLAYMIKRARHGYYCLIEFNAPTAIINELNQQIKLMPEIIRHRIIIKQKNITPPIKTKTDMANSGKTDAAKPASPLIKTDINKEKSNQQEKVDTKELNRKIDELLSQDI